MSTSTLDRADSASHPGSRWPFYYGWVNLVVAALAMSATLPGRTHGLGLITKQLTTDPSLEVDSTLFSDLNFWAILLGSALCFPVGRWIDRFGVRGVLVAVAAGLGLAVVGMSAATGVLTLFITLTLVRGLGQGALSVVSMAMVGKWFTRRLPVAMAIFTVLLTIGMIVPLEVVGNAAKTYGWREAWFGVGLFLLLVMAPVGALLARSTPEAVGLAVDQGAAPSARPRLDLPLAKALLSPAFWAFTLAMCLFNMAWSAITLFNEELLQSRGLDHDTFLLVMSVLVGIGLPANLLCGWLATRWPMGRLLAVGMLMLAWALMTFPHLANETDAIIFGAVFGISGGIIMVVWFTMYGKAYGRLHLGSIQAVAQVLSVLASALGPSLLMRIHGLTGSFTPLFYGGAALAVMLALAVWIVRLPDTEAAERKD
jgi:MFS family permease